MIGKSLAAAAVGMMAAWLALLGEARAQFVCLMGDGTAAGANASDTGAFACGPQAKADGVSVTSIGASAGLNSTPVTDPSDGSMARGANTWVGTGAGAFVTGNQNTAMGFSAGETVTGNSNSAFGNRAGQLINGDNNVAIGNKAGSGSVGSSLAVSDTVAIGNSAQGTRNGAIAIGSQAKATAANAVAIGSGSVADQADTVSVGKAGAQRRLTHLAAGIAPTDAVNVGQLNSFGTSLGSEVQNLYSRVTVTENNISVLDNRVGALEGGFAAMGGRIDQAFEGTAMALAMAGGALPSDKNYALSVNWGNFEGENAFAGSGAFRISDNTFVHGGVGLGARRGTVGARAGVTLAW